jgi:hypothetical protein
MFGLTVFSPFATVCPRVGSSIHTTWAGIWLHMSRSGNFLNMKVRVTWPGADRRRTPSFLQLLAFGPLLLASLLLNIGCAYWPAPTGESTLELPRPQMSPDTVVLEVATVHFPETADGEGWWRVVDEQAVPHELRERMAENGFRCGVIRGSLPDELRDQLDTQRMATREVDPENSPSLSMTGEQRLQSRAGKRSKILISEIQSTMAILVPQGERLTGQTLSDAQCLFSLKSFPRGDGRADIEITPEIEHGISKQKWIGQAHEGTFRIDANRERLILETLRVRSTLAPGQIFVVSSTPESKGVGRQFCVSSSQGPPERRTLLIRLAQTQIDDLFSEQVTSDPLTTPLD